MTFAPIVRWPTSVWIRYAKSSGVAPAGRSLMSPFGVNTKTWSWKMSSLTPSTNSVASLTSRCQSMSWRSQASLASYSRSAFEPSLYRQCAAMPTSETWCIACGPDLDLERLAVHRDDRGVERLVEVVLGDGDVVVELAGDRAPQRVDDAQRRVAVAEVVDEDADRVDVVDLAELRALALHLLPDAVDVLRPAVQVGLDAGGLEARLELGDRPVDERLAPLAPGVEELGELAEPRRLEDLEREVLELPLDLPDAQALGERRVDLEGLARDPELLLRRQAGERPHVVEAVGELDQDDADVLRHRQEHLPDVLGLLLLERDGRVLAELGHAVDELGDLRAEPLLDVRQRVLGVLGDVVEERGLDRDRVDVELGEDLGRCDRMA